MSDDAAPSSPPGPLQRARHRLLPAILTIGSLTMFAKLTVFARDLALASRFGTNDPLDAYLIAYAVPLFAVNVLNGSLNVALVPTFVRVSEQEGHAAAQRLLGSVSAASVAFAAVWALLLASLSHPLLHLLAPGFSPLKAALARQLFVCLLPILVLSTVSASWAGVLQSRRQFVAASLAPTCTALFQVVLLLVFGSRLGIFAVVVGALIGFAAEATILGVALARAGFSPTPRWAGVDRHVRSVLGQYAPLIGGQLLMWGTTVIDQAMASQLGAGSVAILGYGNRVVTFAVGLGSISINTALLPHYSEQVARRDWPGLRQTLRMYFPLVLGFSLLITASLMVFSQPIVRILFQRGSFHSGDTAIVAQVQALYALQIPFFLGATLLVRLISALGANHILLLGCGLNLVVDVVGNYVLMHWLGVRGIALSSSVFYATSFFYLAYFVRRQLRAAR